MKLNHIALNIANEEDIVDFYQNILGLKLGHHFILSSELCSDIFEVNKQLPAFFYKKDNVSFELFVYPENFNLGVAHICLETTDCKSIIAKCNNSGYKVKKIHRDNRPDLIFIEDKTGNSFEIKEDKKLNYV